MKCHRKRLTDSIIWFFSVRAANVNYENMFEELPISIKSSHLMSVLMAELALQPSKMAENESIHLEVGTKR